MSTPEPDPVPDPTLSSDATHSTYEPATDVPDALPPPGPQVIQTRGKPGATAGSKSSSKASTTAAKST